MRKRSIKKLKKQKSKLVKMNQKEMQQVKGGVDPFIVLNLPSSSF